MSWGSGWMITKQQKYRGRTKIVTVCLFPGERQINLRLIDCLSQIVTQRDLIYLPDDLMAYCDVKCVCLV